MTDRNGLAKSFPKGVEIQKPGKVSGVCCQENILQSIQDRKILSIRMKNMSSVFSTTFNAKKWPIFAFIYLSLSDGKNTTYLLIN